MKKIDTYEKYMAKVRKAFLAGFTQAEIIKELGNEIDSIRVLCVAKSVALQANRSPYPGREVRRAATECISTIERIIKEIQSKEVNV